MMKKKCVAIDADFFINCVKYQSKKKSRIPGTLFLGIMKDLNAFPVMHKYVADQEIVDSQSQEVLSQLKRERKLTVYDYNSFLELEERKDYAMMFEQLYFHSEGIRVPTDKDIFTWRAAQGSLGELHTLLMAFWLNGKVPAVVQSKIELLLSNDRGTKSLLKMGIIPENQKIPVYNIVDTLRDIRLRPHHSLQWDDVKLLAKGIKKREEIKEIFFSGNLE